MNAEKIRFSILDKMIRLNLWSKRHILEENLLKGAVPRAHWEQARNAIKTLVQEGFVIIYGRTKHGIAYQLNASKRKEIHEDNNLYISREGVKET